MRTVQLSRRRLMIDGKPSLMLSGEVHYFRLDRADWASRLDLLVAAGCDAVATYMPWLVHELPDGSVDLVGRTSPYRDLAGFLELAASRGLSVIARPGPFVMAELKNEGLPFSVYEPGVGSVGWDSTPAPTRDVDYLAPAYLASVKRWYGEVMPLLASRLAPAGGPVVAVQLDNEVGMLSWVTNTPDLGDAAVDDFGAWVRSRHGASAFGLSVDDVDGWRAGVRSPGAGSLALHHELSVFQRDRYARYFAFLRREAESHGVSGVPFLINLHGTGEGRGRTYPIGISQLFPSYSGEPAMTSGSDHYLGDLTVENVADLYVMNAFMAAVHSADQPLTSLEFEAGLGDYGEDLSRQVPPSALALKTRLCVAQGNRLLNYYLFAGGHNPPLDVPVGDGNDRIAFTGERHGFTAPVDSEGQLNPSYPVLASTLADVRSFGDVLADSDEEFDDVVLGFVPDHYLTEYCHPGDDVRRDQVANLERFRGMGPRDVLARSLLLAGFSFPAVNLQSDFATTQVLCLASTPWLSAEVQQRLADFVLTGGRLLLVGALPTHTPEGTPCTVLADALSLAPGDLVNGSPHYFPSVKAAPWTTATAEVRVGVLQPLTLTQPVQPATGMPQPATGMPQPVTDAAQPVTDAAQPGTDAAQPATDAAQPATDAALAATATAPLAADAPEPATSAPPAAPPHPPAVRVTHEVFAADVSSKSPVGVEVHAGHGHALILTCDYPAHLPFWTTLLARLGATPRHTHNATTPGIVLTSTTTPTGTRLLHALNVSPIDQSLVISHQGTPLFEAAEIPLPARTGRILPL